MASTASCLISISCRIRHSGSLYTLTVNANSVKFGVQSSVLQCSSSKSGSPMYYNYTYACSKATGKDLSCHVVGVHSKRSVRSVRVYGRRREEEENEFGMYPWDASSSDNNDEALQWVQEDTITLFTTDGLMQIGGSVVPRRINSSHNFQGRLRASQRYRRFQEENYMDPNQGLCLGAIFDIAATNGLDLGRRFCIFGFCRSIEMLSDMVEDTVLEQGGEVVVAEKESKGGLQEKLTMTVAVPLLWGIPPAAERLRFAVRSGGGIVEKVYWQWNFL